MRASVERDQSVGVVPRVEDHHHPRRLLDLEIEAVVDARHAHRRTAIFRLDIRDLHRCEERVEEVSLFRACPWLIRNFRARRRIDNQDASVLEALSDLGRSPAAAEGVLRLRTFFKAVRRIGRIRRKVAVDVRLAIRGSRRVERRLRLTRGGAWRQRQSRDHRCHGDC
jgi:hypothetical protein